MLATRRRVFPAKRGPELRAVAPARAWGALLGNLSSLRVVLATTNGSSVDAALDTATSFVRFVVSAEHAEFVDLVGRTSVTARTHTAEKSELHGVPPCELVVAMADQKGKQARCMPGLSLAEPMLFADVLAQIQAALALTAPVAPLPLAANGR